MKIKNEWIEYIIIPSKKRTGESCFVLEWRSSRLKDVRNWHGIITEEEIKNLLSRKQFNEWKSGKRNSFIKHLSIEQRKSILKHNNTKSNQKNS
jgi:hypothetical protein